MPIEEVCVALQKADKYQDTAERYAEALDHLTERVERESLSDSVLLEVKHGTKEGQQFAYVETDAGPVLVDAIDAFVPPPTVAELSKSIKPKPRSGSLMPALGFDQESWRSGAIMRNTDVNAIAKELPVPPQFAGDPSRHLEAVWYIPAQARAPDARNARGITDHLVAERIRWTEKRRNAQSGAEDAVQREFLRFRRSRPLAARAKAA